ncbi:MAG: hypothetical protein QM784_30995 [Polyangiaceae bacterium]
MRLRLWAVPLVVVIMATCARRSPDTNDEDAGTGGTGAEAGVGGSGGARDAMVARDRDLSEASFVYDGPSDDGFIDHDAACAELPVAAQPVALDMYLMLDRSGTMGQDCSVGSDTNSRWCYAINALSGFFTAPTSNGVGVALGFTPHGTCGVSGSTDDCCAVAAGDCCQGDADAIPDVALGELPLHALTLVTRLNEQSPRGTASPIEAALRGLTLYTAKHVRSDRKMVSVITTDGNPNGCERDVNRLAKILSDHRAATGQLSFVIGMTGANYPALEVLAKAGGAAPHTTHCAGAISPCSFYDVGDGNPEAFVDALQQIQRSVVGCRFGLPQTDAGIVDPATLVVEWSTQTEPTPTRLSRVQAPADCGEGWYADPEQPSEFVLCPKSCDLVQQKTRVRIDVLAGCLGS